MDRLQQSNMDQLLTSEGRPFRAALWYVAGGIFLVVVLTRLLLSAFTVERTSAQPTAPVPDLPRMRLTEGRLSGQTAYAPYPTPLDKRHRPSLELLRASVSFRDRALYHLLVNDLDRAVAYMEEAVRTTPGKALLLSDLSALYGERARAKNQPEDYVASLEMAERAVEVGPDIPEVAFNHTLALEHLFLRDQAIDGWRHCTLINGINSGWSQEIKRHADRLFFEDQYTKNYLLPLPPALKAWFVSLEREKKDPSPRSSHLESTVTSQRSLALLGEFRKILSEDGQSDRPNATWQADLALPVRKSRGTSMALSLPPIATLIVFGPLGEASKAAATQNQIASILESLGQSSEAWRYHYDALDWTSRVNDRASRAELQFSRRLERSDHVPPAAIALETFETAAQASLAQLEAKGSSSIPD